MMCPAAQTIVEKYTTQYESPPLDLPLNTKEIFEAYAFNTIVSTYLTEYKHIVECCAGNGLAGLLFADKGKKVTHIDIKKNNQYDHVRSALNKNNLIDSTYIQQSIYNFIPQGDAYISIHACGELTDKIIEHAIAMRKPFAVVPCCHSSSMHLSEDILKHFLHKDEAIDALRIYYAQSREYTMIVKSMPTYITKKNKILIGII